MKFNIHQAIYSTLQEVREFLISQGIPAETFFEEARDDGFISLDFTYAQGGWNRLKTGLIVRFMDHNYKTHHRIVRATEKGEVDVAKLVPKVQALIALREKDLVAKVQDFQDQQYRKREKELWDTALLQRYGKVRIWEGVTGSYAHVELDLELREQDLLFAFLEQVKQRREKNT